MLSKALTLSKSKPHGGPIASCNKTFHVSSFDEACIHSEKSHLQSVVYPIHGHHRLSGRLLLKFHTKLSGKQEIGSDHRTSKKLAGSCQDGLVLSACQISDGFSVACHKRAVFSIVFCCSCRNWRRDRYQHSIILCWHHQHFKGLLALASKKACGTLAH